MDFKLSPEHDIIWNNRPLTRADMTQPYTETVAQRLKIRLLTFKNEWQFNTDYGPPWWQEILGKKPGKARVDAIFQEQILLEVGVKEIVSFVSTFVNRQYSLTFSVKVVSGDVTESITITPTI